MSNQKKYDWLQIIANAGIIIGLVLVGLEIKQNSDLVKAQLLYEESQRFVSYEMAMLGDNPARVWAKAHTEPESLTLEERRIMEAYFWTFTEQARATQMLAEKGLFADENWQSRVANEASFFFGNEYGYAWWQIFGKESEYLNPELVRAIDEGLAGEPHYTMDYMNEVMERFHENRSTAGQSSVR